VFHDSCYLGRYNGIYDAPREVIASVTGCAPSEMERRNMKNHSVCGVLAGRMWMKKAGNAHKWWRAWRKL